MPRSPLLAACLAVLVLALAGCGDDGGSGGAAEGGSGAFPARIADHFGTTTIKQRPVRVVAMSWTDADFALELGIKPVGIAKVSTSKDGLEPWHKPLLGDAEPKLFSTDGADPIETVAALRPDVILATKDYNLPTSRAKLAQIAPVVAYAQAPNSGAWEQDAVRVGRALGREDRARALVARVRAQLASASRRHPALRGKTFSLAIQPENGSVFTVKSAQDVSAQTLGRLGLRLAPAVQKLPTSSIPGRAKIGFERLDLLDANLLLATGAPAGLQTLRANGIYSRLASKRGNGYLALDPPTAQSLAFPSPVSLQYALRTFVPRLADAARGG